MRGQGRTEATVALPAWSGGRGRRGAPNPAPSGFPGRVGPSPAPNLGYGGPIALATGGRARPQLRGLGGPPSRASQSGGTKVAPWRSGGTSLGNCSRQRMYPKRTLMASAARSLSPLVPELLGGAARRRTRWRVRAGCGAADRLRARGRLRAHPHLQVGLGAVGQVVDDLATADESQVLDPVGVEPVVVHPVGVDVVHACPNAGGR